jgi:eukaryotic-like serine/threonine-protein kinase
MLPTTKSFPPPLAEDWLALKDAVRRFEGAWRQSPRPGIDDYLPAGDPIRSRVLIELVHIDLELRLKAGGLARVEEYLARYPELNGDRAVILDLIAAEYELRRRRESDLAVHEYLQRFPQFRAELSERISRSMIAGQDASRCPTDPAEEAPPEVAGFEILGLLGRGGMGVVYKARQIGLNRRVALKMILAGAGASTQIRARFHTEAMAAARLQHPHIVQVYHIGEQRGQPYFSLELVEGGTLAQKLAGQPQPASEAARIIETLARALYHAHQHGIIHRDLKPANILLSTDGTPKISDFGLAKSLEDDMGHTRTGTIVGTPNYMAPEQASGPLSAVGPAVDIYALGVILYEMLTGRPPFCAKTPLETLDLVRTQEPVPPRRRQPAIPRDLETICLQCLAKESSKRYATALDLADDLGRFRADKPIEARPVHALERGWRWCRRNPVPATLLACVVLLLAMIAAGASLAAWKLDRERDRAVANQKAAEQAEDVAKEQLWSALLAQAQANRLSGRAGRNFGSLDVLAQAVALRPSLELRNEAIACMSLVDLRLVQADPGSPKYPYRAFDARVERSVYCDERGNLSICSLQDGREILRLPGPGCPAWLIRFSPNGRFLTARHHPANGSTRFFYLWDLSDGETIRKGPIRLKGFGWDFSPDSRRLAIGRDDDSLVLHEIATGHEVRLACVPRVYTIAFDPPGRRLGLATWEPGVIQVGSIQVRDAATGALLDELKQLKAVRGLAWSPDGAQLAGACADSHIRLWRPGTGQLPLLLKGHQSEVVAVAFNHQGDLLASTAWDETVRLWDVVSGKQLMRADIVGAMPQFSLDDRRLGVVLASGQVGMMEVAHGGECRTLHAHESQSPGLWAVDFSPDGQLLASAGSDGVHVWDAVTLQEVAPLLPVGETRSVIFHPDGHRLITKGNAGGMQSWPIRMDLSGSPHRLRIGPPELLEAGKDYERLAISRDGRSLATIRDDTQAVVWDADRPAQPVVLKGPENLAFLALSPDGRWLATSTWHGEGTQVWNVRTRERLRELASGDAFVVFSPDGRWLVNGTEDEYCFWEVGSWRPGLRIPRNRRAGPGPLAFTTDGKIVAIAHSVRDLRLIETATGRELATLAAPEPYPIRWLCFRPDGEQLAVACAHGVLQLWNLRRIRERLAELGLDWE